MSHPAEWLMDMADQMLSQPRSGAVTDSQNRAKAPHASNLKHARSSLFFSFIVTAWASFRQRVFSENSWNLIQHQIKVVFLIPPVVEKQSERRR